jgi:flagellar basal-body rod protein FlgB
MAINLDKLMGFHHKALQVRTDRMEVLAGNLANANHINGSMQSSGELQFRIPNQPDTGDGNTVDVQIERNAFLDNGLRYQAGMEFLNSKIKGMKKALSGGQ